MMMDGMVMIENGIVLYDDGWYGRVGGIAIIEDSKLLYGDGWNSHVVVIENHD